MALTRKSLALLVLGCFHGNLIDSTSTEFYATSRRRLDDAENERHGRNPGEANQGPTTLIPTATPTITPPVSSPTSTPPLSSSPTSTPPFSSSPTSTPPLSSSPTSTPPLSSSPTSTPTAPTAISPTTADPSAMPSAMPTEFECRVNQDGFFGRESETTLEVEYKYDITYNASAAPLETEILPDVEVAVADKLLGLLFNSLCDFSRRRRRLKGRKLAVVGITGSPDEYVIEQVNCLLAPPAGYDCKVVDGSATIYTDGTGEIFDVQGDSQKTIKEAMDSNEIDSAHPDILSVTFRVLTPLQITDNNPSNASRSTGDPIPVFAYVVMAGGGAMILLAALIAYRRRREDEDLEDEFDLDDSGENSFDGGFE